MFWNIGGQPSHPMIYHIPLLLTVLNAYSLRFSSWHFSWNCWRNKTIYIELLLALKLHRQSGRYSLVMVGISLYSWILVRNFLRGRVSNSTVTGPVRFVTFLFLYRIMTASRRSCGSVPCSNNRRRVHGVSSSTLGSNVSKFPIGFYQFLQVCPPSAALWLWWFIQW